MASMDIFNSSAFSMTSLTGAVEKIGYKPQLLGQLGIFEPMPVRTRSVFVDRRENKLVLIPSSPIGAGAPSISRAYRPRSASARATESVQPSSHQGAEPPRFQSAASSSVAAQGNPSVSAPPIAMPASTKP